MGTLINILIDGVVYGLLLFMIAVGLTITMGLMRFINLAHGVFAMLGGYAAIWLIRQMGLPWLPGVIIAVLAIAAISVPLERWLVSRVYQRPPLDQVLLTIGIVFCMVAISGLVFGTRVSSMPFPEFLSGSLDLGFKVLPAQRILVVSVGVASFVGLWLLLEKTRFGIQLRATVDNVQTASAMGINTRRVATLAFALGAGMAALGGIVGSALMPIEPYYPLTYMVLFLAVVAVGGQGNLTGTLVGALLLGMIDTATKYLAPQLSSILFFVAIIVIISLRPNGLFGRAAV
ncbi:branched-chain amino acid ABC transporter permease [Saccharospirillum alexandrii]|uniref:branched-chain amino acid ABC transporter permease n=1 Tax=Saccharospirillum alexandrii TaxID=2448477 RepID=UPI000FD80EAA|nr:branched-chain amino acid ABC transporter permease [Saccharospirillum alexandrii]